MAYALLRIGLGMLFLLAAVGKLQNLDEWIHGQTFQNFSKLLPSVLLTPYLALLPFVELIVGICLLFGLFTRPALKLAGLTLLSLSVGLLPAKQHAVVANNFIDLIAVAALLVFADQNALALDCFRKGKPENRS